MVEAKIKVAGTDPDNFPRPAMDWVCREANLDFASVRFACDGRRLQPTDSPRSAEMEEGDVIEMYQEQTGGL